MKDNENLIKFGQEIYSKHPALRPFLTFIKKNFFNKPKFSGWGMTSIHEPPWLNDAEGKKFLEIHNYIKNNFVFNKKIQGTTKDIMDDLLWRHWIVSYAVKHATKFAKTENYNLVECGVEWGYTAFFALKTLTNNDKKMNSFSMHLYDAWQDMREEELLESEYWHVNLYKNLDIESTKKNLIEFKENLIFHQGFIPNSLTKKPNPPEEIFYRIFSIFICIPTIIVKKYYSSYN